MGMVAEEESEAGMVAEQVKVAVVMVVVAPVVAAKMEALTVAVVRAVQCIGLQCCTLQEESRALGTRSLADCESGHMIHGTHHRGLEGEPAASEVSRSSYWRAVADL